MTDTRRPRRPNLQAWCLWLAGIVATGLMAVPLTRVAQYLFLDPDGGALPRLPLLMVAAAGWLHVPLRRLFMGRSGADVSARGRVRTITANLLDLLLGPVVAAAATWVTVIYADPMPGKALIFVYFAAAWALWIVVGRSASKKPTSSYGDPMFVASLVIFALQALIARIRGFTGQELPTVIVLAVQLTIWALLRNQKNLDDQMARGRHRAADLPLGIRRRNLLMVLGFSGIFVLLVLLRHPLGRLLTGIKDGLSRALRALLRRMFSESDEPVTPIATEPSRTPQDMMPPLEHGEPSPWWNIFYVLIGAAILYLLYTYRYEILAVFRNLWEKLRALLARLLRRDEARELTADRGAYEDQTFRLDRPDRDRRREVRRWSRHPERALRREARSLLRGLEVEEATEGVRWSREDVRRVYRLLLIDRSLHGEPKPPGRTPRQMAEALRATPDYAVWAPATDAYEPARYDTTAEPERAVLLDPARSRALTAALEAMSRGQRPGISPS